MPADDDSAAQDLDGVSPDEMPAREMNTVRMSGSGGGMWQPPSIEEAAGLFPQYEVLGLLGRGGMGAVYQARQIALDRHVAIKLLPLEVSADRDFADRFVREARAMGRLNHPNIIAVYDFGQTPAGHWYFAMEFVEGTNLHQVIHGPGLAPAQALSIIGEVCDALAYAHGKGVVHRDIKPANVMVNLEGRVKVADFGLARLTDPSAEQFGHTQTGTVMGTPDYMAPEQKRGMNVDHRADIYSLGVMLYEMLCKETPQGVFDPPSHRVAVDARVDQVVIKAMQQTPDRRFQSSTEMKAMVDYIRTMPAPKPRPGGTAPLAAAAKANDRTLFYVGGGVAALVVLVVAVLAFSGGEKRRKPAAAARATPSAVPEKPAAAPVPPPVVAAASSPRPAVVKPPASAPATPVIAMERSATPAPPPSPGARALFDGKTLTGWHGYAETGGPRGWFLKDGALVGEGKKTTLVTDESFGDFELSLEWRVGTGGNGGILFLIGSLESGGRPECPEMNLMDDALAPKSKTGSLFDVQEATKAAAKPLDEWNTAKLVQRGGKAEHWVNDQLVCAYDLSATKFSAKMGGKGKIGLQGWTGEIAYRNVTLRSLDAAEPAPAPTMPTSAALTFGGHRYEFVPDLIGWADAKAKAEAMGGHLVAITSKAEDDAVREAFKSNLKGGGDPLESLWIGASRPTADAAWSWVTGEPFAYTNWAGGEPNLKSGNPPWVLTYRDQDARWRDDGITVNGQPHLKKGFIVEWDDVQRTAPTLAAQSVTGKWLAEQVPQWEAAFAKEVTAPFEKGAGDLRKQYLAALDGMLATATRTGKLDDAVAYRADRERMSGGGDVPAEDEALAPAGLRALRANYRPALAKLDAERFAKAKSAHARYDAILAQNQTALTQRQRLDEALELKTQREALGAAWLKPPAGAAPAATPAPATPKPALGQAMAPPPSKAPKLKRRELVERLLAMGATVKITQPGGHFAVKDMTQYPGDTFPIQSVEFRKHDGLTEGDLDIVEQIIDVQEIYLEDVPATDATMEKLRGLSTIRTLAFSGLDKLTGAGFKSIAAMPALNTLDVGGTISTESLTALGKARKLMILRLAGATFTEQDFAAIATIPALKELVINGVNVEPVPTAAWARLANAKKLTRLAIDAPLNTAKMNTEMIVEIARIFGLEYLSVANADLPDAALAPLAALKSLNTFGTYEGTPLDGSAFATWPLRPAMKILSIAGKRSVADDALRGIAAAFPKLEQLSVRADTGSVTAAGFAHLPKLRHLSQLFLAGDAVDDAACAELAKCDSLTSLGLGNARATEAGAQSLTKLSSLRSLDWINPPVTDAALKSYGKLRALETFKIGQQDPPEVEQKLKAALPKVKVVR